MRADGFREVTRPRAIATDRHGRGFGSVTAPPPISDDLPGCAAPRDVAFARTPWAIGVAMVDVDASARGATSVTEVVAEAQPVAAFAPRVASRTEQGTPFTALRDRDRYTDILCVLALGQIVLYHTLGWAWLALLFPSIGVMFALAGSLTASSLDGEKRHYGFVLRRRLRRLLFPFWAFGAVVLAVMFSLGWQADAAGNGGPDWGGMVYWLLPIAQPPGSVAGTTWTVPLWFVTTYLWLVLLSPALLWSFRRWPVKTLATPLILLACVVGSVLVFTDRIGDVTLSVATYTACWLLGFAHHDGRIRKLPLWLMLTVGGLLASAGLGWAVAYPEAETGTNITDIPMASALYNLGVVLILLRVHPNMSWLARIRWLSGLVRSINRRAMTIYLWSNLGIDAGVLILHQKIAPSLVDVGAPTVVLDLAASWVMIWVFVFAFGWAEDLAARRPLQIVPRAPRKHRSRRRLPRWSGASVRAPMRSRAIVDHGAAS